MRHVFSLAAYGESRYLEETLKSLLSQQRESPVIICTSTPSDFLDAVSAKYGVELYIREGESSLSADWNFCIETARDKKQADIVTIAHQDDIYRSDYSEELFKACERYPDMSLFMSDFKVIDALGQRKQVSYERIKRFLRLPLRLKSLAGTRTVKRFPLIYGNSVAAPTLSYHLKYTGLPVFTSDESFVLDWRMLLRMSEKPGRFISVEKPLIDYRVHEGSETMKAIDSGVRYKEEYEVLRDCHTRIVADILMHFYKRAESAYR